MKNPCRDEAAGFSTALFEPVYAAAAASHILTHNTRVAYAPDSAVTVLVSAIRTRTPIRVLFVLFIHGMKRWLINDLCLLAMTAPCAVKTNDLSPEGSVLTAW
jgi:hypothetical protein